MYAVVLQANLAIRAYFRMQIRAGVVDAVTWADSPSLIQHRMFSPGDATAVASEAGRGPNDSFA